MLAVIFGMLIGASLASAAAAQKPQRPQVGSSIRHDVSPTLREMALATEGQIPVPRAPKEIALRKPSHNRGAGNQTFGPDPLRQTEFFPAGRQVATPAPTLSFDGLSNNDNSAVVGFGVVPPDTEGDVGPNHYMQWINLVLAVWDKQGNLIFGPVAGNSLWAGFGGACETKNDGDPVIFYDHLADRWMISQFAINEGIQCIAVSTSGDPTGSYVRYAFLVTPGGGNDYPKLGLWTDGAGQSAYHMSLRDFNPNFNTSAVAFDRDALLAGSPTVQFVKFANPCVTGNCIDGLQPPHLEGPAPAVGSCADYFAAWDDDFEGPFTGTDGYRNYQLCVDWNNPANATFQERTIAASSGFNRALCGFFQRNCIRQPSPGERLDPFDEATMYRAQFRSFSSHNSVVLTHSVDANGSDLAGVRWAELRQTTINGPWTVFQESTYSPDSVNRWMGSIAMDQDGNIALGYSVASRNTFPGVRYTSRMAGDTLGQMTGGEAVCVNGSGVQSRNSFNRWGDYSTMSVDPVDGCTFWYTQEYYETTGSFNFRTRICSFKIPGCGGGPGGPVCGNGTCEAGEDCMTCQADCPMSTGGTVCGNGVCEPLGGEDCLSCAADCAGAQNGKPSNRFCCGDGAGQNPVGCGDARCTAGGFQCDPNAGGGNAFCCGDGVCDIGEVGICPIDCAP